MPVHTCAPPKGSAPRQTLWICPGCGSTWEAAPTSGSSTSTATRPSPGPNGSGSRAPTTWPADVSVDLRNAPTLAPPPGYSHVAIATSGTLIFTAGAVPLDGEGNLVGKDDAVTQAEKAIENLLVALEEGGRRRPTSRRPRSTSRARATRPRPTCGRSSVRPRSAGRRAPWLACRPSATAVSSSRSKQSRSSSEKKEPCWASRGATTTR